MCTKLVFPPQTGPTYTPLGAAYLYSVANRADPHYVKVLEDIAVPGFNHFELYQYFNPCLTLRFKRVGEYGMFESLLAAQEIEM